MGGGLGAASMSFATFAREVRRRNVVRASALYIASAWALAQGIAQLYPFVGAPEWTTRGFLVAAAIGFPFWVAFAWLYEFAPARVPRESDIEAANASPDRRDNARKLDFWIIGALTVAV